MLSVSTVIVNFFHYFFHVLSARAVGPVGYGEIVSVFSYLAIASIPFSTIPAMLIRRLGYAGKRRAEVARAIEIWALFKLKQWWLLAVVLFLLAFVIPSVTKLSLAASFILVFAVYFGLMNTVYMALLNGLQLFAEASIVAVISAGIKLSGAAIAFIGFAGLRGIYTGLGASILFGILYGRHILTHQKQHPKKTYTFDRRLRSVLLETSTLLTSFSLLGIVFLGNVDIIYVKKFFPDDQAGIYGAWSLFAKTLFYFLGPINALTLIFFSAKETKKNQTKTMYAVLCLLVLTGISAWGLYTIFSRQLVAVILGKEFSVIAQLLPQAAIFGILYAACNIMNNYFVARKHKAQIVGFLAVPIYIVSLFFMGTSVQSIIQVNISYSAALAGAYIFIFLSSRYKTA